MTDPTTAAAGKATRGPKPRLSPAEIVDCAIDMLDRDGRAALNLRALAQELEISTMALYRYFENKDELLDAIVAGAVREVTLDPELAWDARLAHAFDELYAALHRHPAVAEIAAMRRPGAPLDPLRAALFETIQEGGFSSDDSARALRALSAYVFGFALIATPELRRRHAQSDFAYGLEMLLQSLRNSAPSTR